MHRVAALLEWHIVVIAKRREEDLRVPDKALSRSEVRDLVVPCQQQPCRTAPGRRGRNGWGLTSRMGPSGSSPILMVVHSCLEKAEPG